IMRPHLAAAKASLDDAHEPHLAQYIARVEFLKREIAEEEAELNEARAALTLEANTERNTKFESSLEGVAQEAASLIFGQGKKPAREQIKKVEEIIRSAL
ncbi:MAG TPA: hypothetical protein VJJ82_00950, partial [Candidatus Nanoarchaeia archaeon]|nr:hypothetical protein [Candidatus Nanoarchaeia archaeon]